MARITLENRISFTFCEADLPITVGRDKTSKVHLPYNHVSRYHCEIFLSDGQLTVRDTSTNGTEIEGMLIRGGDVPVRGTMTLSFAGQTSFALTTLAAPAARKPSSQTDRRFGDRRETDRRQGVIEVDFERRHGVRRRSERRLPTDGGRDITSWGRRETISLDRPLVSDPDDN